MAYPLASGIRDWLSNWVARGWKGASGAPVKNKAVIQHLAHLLDNRPGKVRLQYVRYVDYHAFQEAIC